MNNIFRNITPAVVVMVAGLAGAYFVYDNFFSTADSTNQMIAINPAAGESLDEIILAEGAAMEAAPPADTAAAPAMLEGAAPEAAVETMATDTIVETTPIDCSAADAAATAAMGGVDAEAMAKAAADCHAAAEAAKASAAQIETKMDGSAVEVMENAPAAEGAAVDAAKDAAAEAVEGHDPH